MTGTWTYLDVGAVRIQRYLSRTPRLKGNRGASGWLSSFTDRDTLAGMLRGEGFAEHRAEVNPEAGEADGVVPLRMPPTTDVAAARIARQVMTLMQSALPAVELAAAWGTGPGYLEVYRERIRPALDGSALTSGPAGADFPALRSCEECRADAVVAVIDVHEKAHVGVCADCSARYVGRYRRPGLRAEERARERDREQEPGGEGVPVYRGEVALLAALGRGEKDAVQDFRELGMLGHPTGNRNHLATVSIDGNAIGAFFGRVADADDPELKARVSRELSAATRAALATAAGKILDQDAKVPVVPHVIGGDDLLVSVVADRAWEFTVAYLEDFARRVASIAGMPPGLYEPVPPTASAGIVFAHVAYPFRRCAELADERLRAAKRAHAGRLPAVSWLDVTREGEAPPPGRGAWSLEDLRHHQEDLNVLRQVEPAGRAVLERLIDTARPAVSAARLDEHARRLDRGGVLDPFLGTECAVDTVADALSIVRWWR